APQARALYWSSDFRSLLPYAADAALDLKALDFLVASGFSASPQTLVRGIRRLGAGKVLVAGSPSTPRVEPGQRYTGRPKQRMTREERSDGFGQHLERAIRRRYEHGRPAAVLLSGGVVSTLLLGTLARGLGAPVPGYTFRHGDDAGRVDERRVQ